MNLLYLASDSRLAFAYLVALHGAVFLLLGVIGLVLENFLRDTQQTRPWRWFGWFAVAKSASVVAPVVIGSIDRSLSLAAFRGLHLVFAAAAALLLAQFAIRAAVAAPRRPRARQWLGVLAIAWLLTGVLSGPETLPFTFPWLLGLPAGLAAAYALLRFGGGTGAGGPHRALRMGAVMLALLTLLEALGPAYTDHFQGWTFNTLDFYPGRQEEPRGAGDLFAWLFSGGETGSGSAWYWVWPMPVGTLLSCGLFISWWTWAKSRAAGAGRASAAWRRLLWVVPGSLLLVVAAGFTLLGVVNARADTKLREGIFAQLETARLVIEPALVRAALAQPGSGAAARLSERLRLARVYNRDFERLYLWRLHEGMIDVVAATPHTATGPLRSLTDNPPERLEVAQPFYCRTRALPNGEIVVSFHVPVRTADQPAPLCWLGADVDAAHYQSGKSETMVVAIVAILLVTTVIVLLLVFQMKHGVELELRGERDRAAESERLKTELLAILSHDVRTPLQSVLAYAGLLQTTALDPTQRTYVSALQQQSQSLLHLLQNLLHLSAAQLGFTPQCDAFSLRRLARELLRNIEGIAAAKSIACRLHIGDDVPDALVGDEVRLKQILLNLLGNAVKFTERGHVELAIAVDPLDPDSAPGTERWLAFHVRDTGPGIPREAQAGLFHLRPGRGSGSSDGIGLGLPLVGKLSLILGGATQVSSTPGIGSEFVVRLPFTIAGAIAPTESTAPLPLILAARPPRRLSRVLLVEDHNVVRHALATTLAQLGFSVATAATAAEALTAWKREPFDAALIDLGLPDEDGSSLLRRLRGEPGGAQAWCIALTAASGEEARRTVSAAGFDRYVPKPADRIALWEALTPAGTPPPAGLAMPASDGVLQELRHEAHAARAGIDAAFQQRDPVLGSHRAHHLRNTALLLHDAELAAAAHALESALTRTSPDWETAAQHRIALEGSAIFRS